jgi:hypothetical protein
MFNNLKAARKDRFQGNEASRIIAKDVAFIPDTTRREKRNGAFT